MPLIRRLGSEEWRAYRDLRLRALADSPDAFGGTFELETARPDDEWRQRVLAASDSPSDLPLVLAVEGQLAGLAWGKVLPADPDTAHLFQMWIAPTLRGRGFGREMVQRVVDWASATGARRIVLRVTEGDTPARRLYERAGFVPEGAPEPLRPGSDKSCQQMTLEFSAGAV